VELVRRTKGTIVVGSQIPPDDEELELLLDEDELEELEELLLEDELDELLEEELELEELEELLLEDELLDDEELELEELPSSPVQVGVKEAEVPSRA
jgi:hypothetical protein